MGVIGGFDSGYQGLGVDPFTAETSATAPLCSVESLGAALLELGGVESGIYVPDALALHGILL